MPRVERGSRPEMIGKLIGATQGPKRFAEAQAIGAKMKAANSPDRRLNARFVSLDRSVEERGTVSAARR